MKNIKIAYWIITVLFAGFMIFTAIPDVMLIPQAVNFMNTTLGYPLYFIPFIGYAKIMGAIMLVVPGFPRLKEWAYAGLTFDLVGAFYSNTVIFGWKPEGFIMVLFIGVLLTSYFLYHKKIKLEAEARKA